MSGFEDHWIDLTEENEAVEARSGVSSTANESWPSVSKEPLYVPPSKTPLKTLFYEEYTNITETDKVLRPSSTEVRNQKFPSGHDSDDDIVFIQEEQMDISPTRSKKHRPPAILAKNRNSSKSAVASEKKVTKSALQVQKNADGKAAKPNPIEALLRPALQRAGATAKPPQTPQTTLAVVSLKNDEVFFCPQKSLQSVLEKALKQPQNKANTVMRSVKTKVNREALESKLHKILPKVSTTRTTAPVCPDGLARAKDFNDAKERTKTKKTAEVPRSTNIAPQKQSSDFDLTEPAKCNAVRTIFQPASVSSLGIDKAPPQREDCTIDLVFDDEIPKQNQPQETVFLTDKLGRLRPVQLTPRQNVHSLTTFKAQSKSSVAKKTNALKMNKTPSPRKVSTIELIADNETAEQLEKKEETLFLSNGRAMSVKLTIQEKAVSKRLEDEDVICVTDVEKLSPTKSFACGQSNQPMKNVGKAKPTILNSSVARMGQQIRTADAPKTAPICRKVETKRLRCPAADRITARIRAAQKTRDTSSDLADMETSSAVAAIAENDQNGELVFLLHQVDGSDATPGQLNQVVALLPKQSHLAHEAGNAPPEQPSDPLNLAGSVASSCDSSGNWTCVTPVDITKILNCNNSQGRCIYQGMEEKGKMRGFTRLQGKKSSCVTELHKLLESEESKFGALRLRLTNFVDCNSANDEEFLPEGFRLEEDEGQTVEIPSDDISEIVAEVNQDVVRLRKKQDVDKTAQALKLIQKGLEMIHSMQKDNAASKVRDKKSIVTKSVTQSVNLSELKAHKTVKKRMRNVTTGKHGQNCETVLVTKKQKTGVEAQRKVQLEAADSIEDLLVVKRVDILQTGPKKRGRKKKIVV